MSWWSRDEVSAVVVPMNAELWEAMRQSGDPVGRLRERAEEQLRTRYGYAEDEVDAVGQDPLFQENSRRVYHVVLGRWRTSRKLPRAVKIEFNRPGTRTAGHRETTTTAAGAN